MKNKKVKNIITVLMIPIGMFLVAETVCYFATGAHLLGSKLEIISAVQNCCYSILAGYALCLNLSSARMDMSLGSQALVGLLIGGNLALRLGMGPLGVVAMCVLTSAIAGLIVGVLFVTLRIQGIILGLGMALVYEAVSSAFAPDGFQLFSLSRMTILGNHWLFLGIAVVIIAVMQVLTQHTRFGIHYNCIRSSQRIARNSGINVNRNVVLCYLLAGALIGLASVFNTGYIGYTSTQSGLASVSIAFGGLLPVLLALFLQGFVNVYWGIPIAVVTFRFLTMCIIALRLSPNAAVCINYGLMLIVLVIMSNLRIRGTKKALSLRARAAEALIGTKQQ